MYEVLVVVAHFVGALLNLIAVLVIAYGSAWALIGTGRLWRDSSDGAMRPIWMAYERWLVIGLTFLLAADIVETVTVPTWEEIGQVAAIAVIRTFLTYFIGRDLETERALRQQP